MGLTFQQQLRYVALSNKRDEHTICAMSTEELNEYKDLCMLIVNSKVNTIQDKTKASQVYALIENHQQFNK